MIVEKLTWPGSCSEALSWHETTGNAASEVFRGGIGSLVQRMRPGVEILSDNIFRSTELQVRYVSLKAWEGAAGHGTTELVWELPAVAAFSSKGHFKKVMLIWSWADPVYLADAELIQIWNS